MTVLLMAPENTDEATREAYAFLTEKGHEVLYPTHPDEYVTPVLSMETKGLAVEANILLDLANVHSVYFCKDWKESKECRFVYEKAVEYAIPVMFEKQPRKSRSAS